VPHRILGTASRAVDPAWEGHHQIAGRRAVGRQLAASSPGLEAAAAALVDGAGFAARGRSAPAVRFSECHHHAKECSGLER